MQAAILAGGLGTRLQSVSKNIPKALMQVGGKPFISWILESLSRNGVNRVVLCLGHLSEQVEHFVQDGSQFGLFVQYSYDGEKLCGTAGALRRALKFLESEFLVMYGDSFLQVDFKEFFKCFENRNGIDGMMTVLKNENTWDSSNVIFKDGELLVYNKKNRTAEMKYIDYGVSILRRSVIEKIPDAKFVDLADVYQTLVEMKKMAGFEVFKRFYEIGTPESWREADEYFSRIQN